MKKIALAVLAAAGLMAAAGAAQAKELGTVKLCGASGCNEVTDREALRGWEVEAETEPWTTSSAGPAPFYTAEIGFGDGEQILHRDVAYWLPASGLMRWRSQPTESWWKLFPTQQSMFQDISSGIEPFVPGLSSVTVNGKAVADPSSYMRLLGRFRLVMPPKGKLRTVKIVLRAAKPNPWIKGTVRMRYQPKRHLLVRPDGTFRVPLALGRQLMKRASLASAKTNAAGSKDGADNVALYAGVGVAGVAGLGVALALQRRRSTSKGESK